MLSGRTQSCALSRPPERRNGNINLSKYFISSSGDRTHKRLARAEPQITGQQTSARWRRRGPARRGRARCERARAPPRTGRAGRRSPAGTARPPAATAPACGHVGVVNTN